MTKARPWSRFRGAINLDVHFHALVPDGVFDVEGDGPARFVPIGPSRHDRFDDPDG